MTLPLIKQEKKEVSKPAVSECGRYAQLHYSLLESMLERPILQNQQQLLQAEVISPRHLVAVVRGLLDSCAKNAAHNDRIQLALDRLAQSVQIAQSSGCLYGNTRKLASLSLCSNKLLQRVLFFSICRRVDASPPYASVQPTPRHRRSKIQLKNFF